MRVPVSLSKELVLQKLPAQLKALYDLLEAKGIDLADLEQANVQRVKLYQGMSKDDEGEAHVTDMAAIQFSPAWESDPEWPVVQQAKPCVIKPVTTGSARKSPKWRTPVTLPACQIGYRKFLDPDGLDPFHDEAAMSVALKLVAHLQPDVIVNLGDFCDFPE